MTNVAFIIVWLGVTFLLLKNDPAPVVAPKVD
jgi:hypothetical protein